MAVQLWGAKGDRLVEVDSDSGRLLTGSVTETDMEDINEGGEAWSLPFDAIDPTNANGIFLYMKNTETSKSLHVRRIILSSSVAGMVEVLRVTGTAAGGSGVTLVNFNEGFSNKTPAGLFETGADITGLADGGKWAFQQLDTVDRTYTITFHHDVILNNNGALALNWVPSTGALTGTVYFFLHK